MAEEGAAGPGPDDPGKEPEERRLAGAVRADQRVDLARGDLQPSPGYGADAAEVLRDAFDLQHLPGERRRAQEIRQRQEAVQAFLENAPVLGTFRAELVGIGLAWGEGPADLAYIPIGHQPPIAANLLSEPPAAPPQLPLDQVLTALAPWLASPPISADPRHAGKRLPV